MNGNRTKPTAPRWVGEPAATPWAFFSSHLLTVVVQHSAHDERLAARRFEVQPRLIQLRVRVLVVADSAVVALQRGADDRAEAFVAVLDQMDRRSGGVAPAAAAPFHLGFVPATGREDPAVEIRQRQLVAIGIDIISIVPFRAQLCRDARFSVLYWEGKN